MNLSKAQTLVVARLAYLGRADLARRLVHQHDAAGREHIRTATHAARPALLPAEEQAQLWTAKPLERLCAPLAAWGPSRNAYGRPRQSGAHAVTEVCSWLEERGAMDLAAEVRDAVAERGVLSTLAQDDNEAGTGCACVWHNTKLSRSV